MRAEVRSLLERAPGVTVVDEARLGGYPTAVTEGANHDPVYVGRIREDISCERGINLWVVVRQYPQGSGPEQRPDCRSPDSRLPLDTGVVCLTQRDHMGYSWFHF